MIIEESDGDLTDECIIYTRPGAKLQQPTGVVNGNDNVVKNVVNDNGYANGYGCDNGYGYGQDNVYGYGYGNCNAYAGYFYTEHTVPEQGEQEQQQGQIHYPVEDEAGDNAEGAQGVDNPEVANEQDPAVCMGCRRNRVGTDPSHNRVEGVCKYPNVTLVVWGCPGCRMDKDSSHPSHTPEAGQCRVLEIIRRRTGYRIRAKSDTATPRAPRVETAREATANQAPRGPRRRPSRNHSEFAEWNSC